MTSSIYGSHTYLDQLGKEGGEPKWHGVDCCGFHKSRTKQLDGGRPHNFFSDDTQLTHAALREGLGVSILPCFMGNADPLLARYSDPDPALNLGLWILLHPDLKRTARVLAFRDHMKDAILEKRNLFEGLNNR